MSETKTNAAAHLWDCIAVNIATGRIRVLSRNHTIKEAEARTKFAVIRRGVDEEYFMEAAAGKYHDGDLRTERNVETPK